MPALGPEWMDPNYLLQQFGDQFFWVSVLIVFIECGLLFPILPGDSLLFAMGLFISNGSVHMHLWVALLILSASAFAGNVAGYEIGRAVGQPLYERDGRLLKKKYFDQTHAFFDKHGNKALVIGRFVPIVRTFITVVAGVGRMERRRFFTWSGIGALLWACSITLLGYFLGKQFPALQDNLELAILVIVAFSLVPAVVEYVRHRRQSRTGTNAGSVEASEQAPHRADDVSDQH